jgi:uncharacterized protein (UPF0210 family)
MRVRTITAGVTLDGTSRDKATLTKAARFLKEARSAFEHEGKDVQTVRVATNPWPDYLRGTGQGDVVPEALRLERLCVDLGIDFLSLGFCGTPASTRIAPAIIGSTSLVSIGSRLGDTDTGVDRANVGAAAEAIHAIARTTRAGYGNFRFCGWANCPPHTPFFPVAYHRGPPSFGIGLECSDLVARAFGEARGLVDAEDRLRALLETEFGQIDALAEDIERRFGVPYAGLDTSIAPAPAEEQSVALACEKLGPRRFGHHGTLTVVALITAVLKSLPLRTCGYCGLMLPVCEDWGLAGRAASASYNLTSLLLYSAVCGCGLDAVPIPGDTPVEIIEAVLLDLATLAIRLNKPLSARLLPVPGKTAGDMTDFGSPYLVDSTILPVR